MAIHYVSSINHQKLWNRNGKRRSLMIGPSYDADQPLFDEHTKHTIYREHKDNTVVLHTDIVSADSSCPYGDKSVDSQIRRQRLWNDVMKLAKPQSPRCRVNFNYALPNSFTEEQAVYCAEEIALSLSRRFHMPCDYSIHYKPNEKPEDNKIHVHGGLPEWTWENGKFASKGKTYYLDNNGDPITDGVFYDANGNHLRVPMTFNNEPPVIKLDENNQPVLDKQGHPIYENQIKTNRGERRWRRFKYENITKKDLSFIHDEVDRIINAELERSGSKERITRPNKEIRQKLKELGLVQKHIGPRSFNTRDARFYEITEHNKTAKKAEAVLTASYNQQKKYSAMKSTFENLKAEIESTKAELAESEKIINDIEATGLNEKVADMVENIIQPEKTFISDAVSQYQKFFREKQKILNPLIQSLEDNISVANDTILEKSKRLKTTPKAKARLKMWNGNVKILNDFASALKSYSAKSFIQNIQKIAKRRWQKLSPWSQVKYIETKKGINSAFLYAAHLDLDMDDDSYDDLKTPKALTVPNLNSIQERANQNKNSIGTFDNENFQPNISTEILSEIVSAESALTETSFNDNFQIFREIDVNAPQKTYRAEIDAIAEQERIAEEKRLAEQKAEQERIAREKARIAEEKRRKAEAERKAKEEALRKAEEEKRLAELKKQEQLQSTEEDAEFKKKQAIHKKLSNLRQEAQDRAIAEIFEIPEAYDEVYDILVSERNKEIDKHTDDPSYILPPPVKKSDVKTIGYQLLLKRSKKFDELCERYEIDISEYKERKNDADTYFEANLAPKQNTEEKEDTSKKKGNLKKQKSNTITRQKTINNTIKTNRS